MNREIKFRIWDKNKKEMNYNPELIFNSNVDLNEQIEALQDRYILQQYIGLKDTNNKEIYEGDIIKRLSLIFEDIDKIEKVTWLDYSVSFVFENLHKHISYINNKANIDINVEIIGNIYENSELLNN